jgi:hypothetical protein
VILLGFAVIVGVLTTRRIQADFNQQVAEAADQLAKQTNLRVVSRNGKPALKYSGVSHARSAEGETSTVTTYRQRAIAGSLRYQSFLGSRYVVNLRYR